MLSNQKLLIIFCLSITSVNNTISKVMYENTFYSSSNVGINQAELKKSNEVSKIKLVSLLKS